MEGRKGQASLEHFQRAAEKSTNSGQVLEMLGELLAVTDPQGTSCLDLSFLHCLHSTLWLRKDVGCFRNPPFTRLLSA